MATTVCRSARSVAKKQRGLTLFELLISMGLLGLLTAIAVPSFQSVTTNSSLATEQNRYTADLTELGLGAAGWNETENGYYEISVVAPDATCPVASCYHLQVRRKSGSAQADDPWDYELWSDGRKRRRSGTSAWISDWKK